MFEQALRMILRTEGVDPLNTLDAVMRFISEARPQNEYDAHCALLRKQAG